MEEDTVLLSGCILLDDYGRILLLHRDLASGEYGHWEIPGGKVETEETPESAAARESYEELGITVRLEQLLGSEIFEDSDANYQFNWFKATIVQGEPQIMEPHLFDDLDYIDLDDIMGLSLSRGMQALLDKIWTGDIVL